MSVLERFARHNHSVRALKERPQMKPKPLQASDDSQQGRSMFSKQRDIIINQVMGSELSRIHEGLIRY